MVPAPGLNSNFVALVEFALGIVDVGLSPSHDATTLHPYVVKLFGVEGRKRVHDFRKRGDRRVSDVGVQRFLLLSLAEQTITLGTGAT